MASTQKSTIGRARELARLAYVRHADRLSPERGGRLARDLWFTPPPRMPEQVVPPGGEPFTVHWEGVAILGQTWGEGPAVYLVHGWGGRGSQLGAFVAPLVERGFRVVAFDAPSHGASGNGLTGVPTNGVEFAGALGATAVRFGPAAAVVAHSLGTISTYLALARGALSAERLVVLAPMVEVQLLFDAFQRTVGFGPRTRQVLDVLTEDFIGLPMADFDARTLAARFAPVPTLVLADPDDRMAPYAQAVDLAHRVSAELVTTSGLGHRRILRDEEVVGRAVDFIAEVAASRETAQRTA